MAIPENFNDFEHLQDVIIRTYNKKVRDSFKDDILDDDIKTPEGALKYACLIKDKDTSGVMTLRMLLFSLVRGDFEILNHIYATPILDYHRDVKFAPQIVLLFKESQSDAKLNKRPTNPVRMRVSFRLNKIDEDSIKQTDLDKWATKARALFPKTYTHVIGLNRYSYRDSERGLGFLIRGSSMNEATEMFKKIIDLIEYIRTNSVNLDKNPLYFAGSKITTHKDESVSTSKTVKLTGLNESYKIPQRYKNVKVHFYKMELHIHGRLVNKDLVFRSV